MVVACLPCKVVADVGKQVEVFHKLEEVVGQSKQGVEEMGMVVVQSNKLVEGERGRSEMGVQCTVGEEMGVGVGVQYTEGEAVGVRVGVQCMEGGEGGTEVEVVNGKMEVVVEMVMEVEANGDRQEVVEENGVVVEEEEGCRPEVVVEDTMVEVEMGNSVLVVGGMVEVVIALVVVEMGVVVGAHSKQVGVEVGVVGAHSKQALVEAGKEMVVEEERDMVEEEMAGVVRVVVVEEEMAGAVRVVVVEVVMVAGVKEAGVKAMVAVVKEVGVRDMGEVVKEVGVKEVGVKAVVEEVMVVVGKVVEGMGKSSQDYRRMQSNPRRAETGKQNIVGVFSAQAC